MKHPCFTGRVVLPTSTCVCRRSFALCVALAWAVLQPLRQRFPNFVPSCLVTQSRQHSSSTRLKQVHAGFVSGNRRARKRQGLAAGNQHASYALPNEDSYGTLGLQKVENFPESQNDDEQHGQYMLDTDYIEEADDLALPTSIGPVKYFGPSEVDGVPILSEPAGEEVDRLTPGDVVAAEVPSDGGHARLLDGRGWLALADGVVEVDPWAAKVMKKPRVEQHDLAALAYLSPDLHAAPPLQEQLPLPQRVLNALDDRGISSASPIQEAVFGRIHMGESLCLQSQTGSGKTLAMVLPLLTSMSEDTVWGADGDKIVVVTSCRELAVQLFSDIESLGFFPQGQGFATLVVVGNVPPAEAVLKANVIIGTPNELGGLLHKDFDIIAQLNTNLRAIVMDEVDDYTTAPRMFGSKWKLKKLRKRYNEEKAVLSNRWDESGKIEWFVKRSLAFARRRDLQVLAASATLSRPVAQKVYRLLRWDPLGRWYHKPPPLVRPQAAQKADWQAVPRMPTLSLDIDHRFVPVAKSETDFVIRDKHFLRKDQAHGGLPRLKVRAAAGQRRMKVGRPISNALAASLMDGLHDALKSRAPGSVMVLISRTVGVTVRDAVSLLRKWGFHEAQGLHETLWEDPRDWPSRWAIKYSYDRVDHSAELAERHRQLNEKLRRGESPDLPIGSPEWRTMEERKQAGESTSPILVGFEGAGRGLHFDGIDTVYILGLPRKPAVYMHLAGRVGRLGQKYGKVVSVLPVRGAKVLRSWEKQIGPNVKFLEEQVERVRSSFGKGRTERRGLLDEYDEDEEIDRDEAEERDVAMLPAGEEYIPVPGSDPRQDLSPEPVDRIREAVRRSR